MNPNLSPEQFTVKKSSSGLDTWRGGGAYAEVDPHFDSQRSKDFFVAWIEGSGDGAGTRLIEHLRGHYGGSPQFADPEENTEGGNVFIESLRRRGLAD